MTQRRERNCEDSMNSEDLGKLAISITNENLTAEGQVLFMGPKPDPPDTGRMEETGLDIGQLRDFGFC